MSDSDAVLHELDEIEGFRAEEPDTSLYLRAETAAHARRRANSDRMDVFLQRPARWRAADRIRRLPRLSESPEMNRAAAGTLVAFALIAESRAGGVRAVGV